MEKESVRLESHGLCEQIAYTYDSLNRLATAQTVQTGGTQWGQSYTYDGFGNLTDQNVIKGSAPTLHVVYSASTNRQTGETADANGNIGAYSLGNRYDIENRLVATNLYNGYAYDPSNKRIWRGDTSGMDEMDFWSVTGQKLGTYHVTLGSSSVQFALLTTNVYFGGKLVSKGAPGGSGYDQVALTAVTSDRLGSIGKFYPYGQEKPSATMNDTEKFTGYYRDAASGLDYADQRYHQPGMGRFMTTDFAPSSKPNDPGSWNKYAYVGGDPVNRLDAHGKYWCATIECEAGSLGDDGGSDGGGSGGNCFFAGPGCDPGYGGGGGSGGGTPDPPPPSCEDTETAYVTAFLTKRGSPLAAYAGMIVRDSDAAGVDDRFIVAMAGRESSYGKNTTSEWGKFNAWSDSTHCAVLIKGHDCQRVNPFTSWDQAISGVISNITGSLYFGAKKPLTTTDSIDAKYNPGGSPSLLNQLYLGELGGGLLADPKEVDFSRCP